VVSPDRLFIISRSPDGKWLAFTGSTGRTGHKDNLRFVKTISVEGGEPRELLSYRREGGLFEWCAWTNDGKYIVFSKPKADGNSELWSVPISGGEPQMLAFMKGHGPMAPVHMRHLSLNPNDSYIAFDSSTPQDAEIWMMRNFLPGNKAEGEKK
jgi:Tol biopolymer transport system component